MPLLIAWMTSWAWGATLAVCPSGCPYASIQAAIDDANDGDGVEVGPGVYAEDLRVNKAISVRGIEGPLRTRLRSADAGVDGTVRLTADGATFEGFGIEGTAAHAAVWVKPQTLDIVVSDVRIDGGGSASAVGGAVSVGNRAGVTLFRVQVTGVQSAYGALYGDYGTDLTVQDSRFADNAGCNGGAIYMRGLSLRVLGSRFVGNTGVPGCASADFTSTGAGGYGGAIFTTASWQDADQTSVLDVRTSVFQANRGLKGGAIYGGAHQVFVADSQFAENTAQMGAAGLMFAPAEQGSGQSLSVITSVFRGDRLIDLSYGGGVVGSAAVDVSWQLIYPAVELHNDAFIDVGDPSVAAANVGLHRAGPGVLADSLFCRPRFHPGRIGAITANDGQTLDFVGNIFASAADTDGTALVVASSSFVTVRESLFVDVYASDTGGGVVAAGDNTMVTIRDNGFFGAGHYAAHTLPLQEYLIEGNVAWPAASGWLNNGINSAIGVNTVLGGPPFAYDTAADDCEAPFLTLSEPVTWGPLADPVRAANLADADADGVIDLVDCDDGDAGRAPYLPEVCDGSARDEDCDGPK